MEFSVYYTRSAHTSVIEVVRHDSEIIFSPLLHFPLVLMICQELYAVREDSCHTEPCYFMHG